MSPLEIGKPADQRLAKTLIFGPSGQGKTYFLGTAEQDERTSPMLLLDFEGGMDTLVGLDVDVARIREWDDYNEAYELLTSDSAENKYKSVGIDSISETHTWALLQILEKEGVSRRNPDLIEMGDYGVASTQMRRLLRHFRDLPIHVFFTAHAKETEERGVGKVKIPSMAGQIAEEVVGLVSVAGYLAIGEEDGETFRTLILQNMPKFRTKVRVPWEHEAPDTIDDPTVTTLLDAVGIEEKTGRKRRTKKEE